MQKTGKKTGKRSCTPSRPATVEVRASDMVDLFIKLNEVFADGNCTLDAVVGAALLSAAVAGRGMTLSRDEFMRDAEMMWERSSAITALQ